MTIKIFRFVFLFLIICSSLFSLSAQDCSKFIAQNKTVNGTQILTSQQFTVIVRGSYSYAFSFQSDERGLTANVYSKGGVTFNKDDEIIFLDANQTRKSYRFIDIGYKEKQGTTPVHSNILQLDLEAVKWLANNAITIFYIKNNISNQMRKMTITGTRQSDMRQQAICFLKALDEDNIKEVDLTATNVRIRRPNSGQPISATKTQVQPVADISALNDTELAELKAKLA